MTVSARGFWLLRGCLGRMPALGRSAVSPLEAPGAAGRAIRGFRGSGVRTSREKRFLLPEVATVYLPTCPHPQSSLLISSDPLVV
ncbi:bifunctional methylenetetrahydrofolate dehydrogenase/cyclohydrolase 2, mitochondrial isoform X9 [Phacochoerus africanus]|uniref:bifunctional methylenetetrahydrofolate dehydrogenase/cyclohydrolase 2, mitochondrial isoform X9 n=1 Tax=Phacochoerus africanus TaxID=41426 RepID=UPI001FDA4CAE|nr:bifunctional methylenetetrahydrofolate dehydrogenase/cyclohydrolase 2, mitochondrial isoform X9 [Phacochoerus africanus]